MKQKKKLHARQPVEDGPDWSKLEAWLGFRGLGWVAGILLVITAGLFLQHLIENNIIGPLGRVIIGECVGVLLCLGWVVLPPAPTVLIQSDAHGCPALPSCICRPSPRSATTNF